MNLNEIAFNHFRNCRVLLISLLLAVSVGCSGEGPSTAADAATDAISDSATSEQDAGGSDADGAGDAQAASDAASGDAANEDAAPRVCTRTDECSPAGSTRERKTCNRNGELQTTPQTCSAVCEWEDGTPSASICGRGTTCVPISADDAECQRASSGGA